jgi:hypothetical protein
MPRGDAGEARGGFRSPTQSRQPTERAILDDKPLDPLRGDREFEVIVAEVLKPLGE